MALIKCPECGKENVSDSAVACPHCGFGIREFFLNKKSDTVEIPKNLPSNEPKSKTVRCNICGAIYPEDYNNCPTCSSRDNKNLQDIGVTHKPKLSKGYIVGIVIGIAVSLLGFYSVSSNETARSLSISQGKGDPHITGSLLALFGLAIIGFTLYLYFKALSRYNLKISDPEKFNRVIMQENIKRQEQYNAQKHAEQARLAKLPECPICKNKKYVRRISSLDRSVSVAMVGLASDKIGKQYECTNCKHKF